MFVRAVPLTVTPALRDWPLTRAAAEECERRDALLPAARAPFGREGPRLEPFGRAIAAQVVQETGIEGRDRATVIADSGGVVAVELVRIGAAANGTGQTFVPYWDGARGYAAGVTIG